MIPEILASSFAAWNALGTPERIVAAIALAVQLTALVALRRFLEVRPAAPTRRDDEDFREAA